MNPLISIIVPVYKAEHTLERCVHSLTAQTYNKLEIILINDGSPDQSGIICDKLAAKDSRITVIHQKNHGVSYTRNHGIDLCSGDFLCFVDSDDYVDQTFITNFVKGLSSTVDIVLQGINEIKSDGSIIKKIPRACIYPNEQILEGVADINQYAMFGYVCNKLYKRELIIRNNLRFDTNINISEDRIFALHYLQYAHKMNVVAASAYNYELQPTGLTMRQNSYDEIKRAADANLDAALLLLKHRQSERFLHDTRRMYIMTATGYLIALFKIKTPYRKINIALNLFKKEYIDWLIYYHPQSTDQKFLYLFLKLPTFATIMMMKVYWFLKKIKHEKKT